MRKMISFAVFALLATSLSAQTVANMKDLNAEKKSAAINLKLTGTLTTTRNSDFRQLRDLCWQLRTLDLSEATCPVLPTDSPDDVAKKVHALEYEHFPQVIEQVLRNKY